MIKLANDAVDRVRRSERKNLPALKGTRWAWVKNETNWTAKQRAAFQRINAVNKNLKTSRAYHIKLALQEFYQQPPDIAEAYLKTWYVWATHARLPEVVRVARTSKGHWNGVLRYFQSRLTNVTLEGINRLVQAARARARGYRSTKNMITMLHLLAGKLDLKPQPT